MLDQILQLVKDQIGGNPQVASTIPQDKIGGVQEEIANQLGSGLKDPGTLISSLVSKFGLPPAAISALSAALPGLLQKFASNAMGSGANKLTEGISGLFSGTGE